MKVLDRYLVRELLVPIIYATIALVFLILIADLFDNLDDLLRHKTPPSVILRYYLSLVPHAFMQIIPWSTWLGTLYLLVNLGFHNEIMAMKAVGLKITTIVKPLLFSGFLIGIVTFIVGDRLVPQAYRVANELREVFIEKKKSKENEEVFRNVTYYSKGNQLSYFRTFWKTKQEVEGVVILWMDVPHRGQRQKMIAKRGAWKGTLWEFENVTEYQMDSRGRILGDPETFTKKGYPEINFSPEELAAASSDSMFLTYGELKNWTQKLVENGVQVNSERVDLQTRLASPWQGLVMMLVAIPLLARTANRKLIAFNVLVCVGLVFAYHVLGAVGIALGKAGKLFPFVSAWAGNILFTVGALLHLEKAND